MTDSGTDTALLAAVTKALPGVLLPTLEQHLGPRPDPHIIWSAKLQSSDTPGDPAVTFTGTIDAGEDQAAGLVDEWARWLGAGATHEDGWVETSRDFGSIRVEVFGVTDRRAFEGDRYQP